MKWKAGKKAAKAGRKKARNRGALHVVAGLLIGSAILRFGDDAGRAFALAQVAEAAPEVDDHVSKTEACAQPPDVTAMLEAFRSREARLTRREEQVADRMQALAVADTEIERKLKQLAESEESLRQTLALADTAAEDDLSRLTAVYQSMKPKEAAALFEEMDPQFAAGFLGRMDPGAAAGVMAGLTPQTAYTVSVILAGRNADVPRE